ncbi:MAG: two-component system C4-dicarboxylate transport sensor histidine kinase DctB [Paraglaciecola sp.]|jgi:two-component system C4-dicarboxylate transport sensor histidine kinase DctB
MTANTSSSSSSSISFRAQLAIWALVLLLFFVTILAGFFIGKARTLVSLQATLHEKSQIIKLDLASELRHFANTAAIYSHNQSLVNFITRSIASKNNSDMNSAGNNLMAKSNIRAINLQLLEIEQATQASDVYLMQTDGKVLAASNWDRQKSFIGSNFSFRHYVQQALEQGQGFELAVGSVSGTRGAYFASVVKHNHQVVGVLVVKANITHMEKSEYLFPLGSNFSFIIENENQQIFLSDQPSWRLKTIYKTQNSAENSLKVSINTLWQSFGFPLWRMTGEHAGTQWLVYQDEFQQQPWKLKILGADQDSSNDGLLLSLTLGISYIAGVSFYLFFRERRRNVAQLQRSHEFLTTQVALRTKDLTLSNLRLSNEVEQRKHAQIDLISTQEQLVQAAKLATIGQLSSSINHELNQPIAALSSFMQSTEKMFSKGMYEQVPANIKRMQKLIDRLISLVAQFKNFSRKADPKIIDVSVSETVNNAIAIVSHHAIQQGVELKLKPLSTDILIAAEPFQLEQVILNLLTNAIDAMTQITMASIAIHFSVEHIAHVKGVDEALIDDVEKGGGKRSSDENITIYITDNGPGIEPHYLNKVFEPFFTTKYHSGLGLGLSISRRIIESFNGQLVIANNDDVGATAKIILPIK